MIEIIGISRSLRSTTECFGRSFMRYLRTLSISTKGHQNNMINCTYYQYYETTNDKNIRSGSLSLKTLGSLIGNLSMPKYYNQHVFTVWKRSYTSRPRPVYSALSGSLQKDIVLDNIIIKNNAILQQIISREKHSKSRSKHGHRKRDSDDSSDEEDDIEMEMDDDLAQAPDNFSLLKIHLNALRVDAVASLGLNIARNKMDDLFYKGRLTLNGEKILKKSQQMSVGDYVDVVVSTNDEKNTVKRVQMIKVAAERTRSDKLTVWVRAGNVHAEINSQSG